MFALRAWTTMGKKIFNLRVSFATVVSQADLEKCGLIPDVITETPAALLEIVYPSGYQVDNGNVLTPTQARYSPAVKWAAKETDYHTLCYTDPDSPSRAEPIFREWHHWLVVNIPGNNVEAGETLSAYIGPAPPPDSGIHRYLYVVYKQKTKMKFNWRYLSESNGDRGGFSIAEFAQKYEMEPIAVNWHQSMFDDFVNSIYHQMHHHKDDITK